MKGNHWINDILCNAIEWYKHSISLNNLILSLSFTLASRFCQSFHAQVWLLFYSNAKSKWRECEQPQRARVLLTLWLSTLIRNIRRCETPLDLNFRHEVFTRSEISLVTFAFLFWLIEWIEIGKETQRKYKTVWIVAVIKPEDKTFRESNALSEEKVTAKRKTFS